MQNHHSLVYREEEREMFPTIKVLKQSSFVSNIQVLTPMACQYFGVGAIPWSPLARGLLTRPMSEQTKRGTVDR
jgi:aryl-alcohol dehydrogenase-like predicted oxidoreductase